MQKNASAAQPDKENMNICPDQVHPVTFCPLCNMFQDKF